MKHFLLLWFLFLGLPSLLHAQTWTGGGGSGDWFDPANWSGGAVPAPNANVNVANAAGQNFTGPGAITDAGGPITVNRIRSVQGCFTVNNAEFNFMNDLTVNDWFILGEFDGVGTVNAGPINAVFRNGLYLARDCFAEAFWNQSGGTLRVTNGGIFVGDQDAFGGGAVGTLNLTDVDVTVGRFLRIGWSAGNEGFYNQTGGTISELDPGQNILIAWQGDGTMCLTNVNTTASGGLMVAQEQNANGEFKMNGGNFNGVLEWNVGFNQTATGSALVEDANLNFGSWIFVGRQADACGVVTSINSTVYSDTGVRVGQVGNAKGTVIQQGGCWDSNINAIIGENNNATGEYFLTDGKLSSGEIGVGWNGNATGVLCTTNATVDAAINMYVANAANSTGTLKNVDGCLIAGTTFTSANGAGTVGRTTNINTKVEIGANLNLATAIGGDADFCQIGGTLDIGNELNVGFRGDGFLKTDDTVVCVDGWTRVGREGSSVGVWTADGSDVKIAGNLELGRNGGGTGDMFFTNSTLTVQRDTEIGYLNQSSMHLVKTDLNLQNTFVSRRTGTGNNVCSLNQTFGTSTVRLLRIAEQTGTIGSANFTNANFTATWDIDIANNAGSVGSMTMNGGTYATRRNMEIGNQGTANVLHTGGADLVADGYIRVGGNNANGTSDYCFESGSITARDFIVRGEGNDTFTFKDKSSGVLCAQQQFFTLAEGNAWVADGRIRTANPADTIVVDTVVKDGLTYTRLYLDNGPDIEVTKTGNGTPLAGQAYSWDIVIENLGGVEACGIELLDELPDCVDFNAVNSPECMAGIDNVLCPLTNNIVTCFLSSLAAGASTTITITVDLSCDPACDMLVNTAAVRLAAGGFDTNELNNTATDLQVVGSQADLVLTKTPVGGTSITPCETLDFELVVVNQGPGFATNVVITDIVPAGFTAVGPTSFMVGTLGCGQASTQVVTLAASGASPGTYMNNATVTSDMMGFSGIDARVVAAPFNLTPGYDLAISKTGPAAGGALDPIQWTITVTNAGPCDAVGLVVTDSVPAEVTFLFADAAFTQVGNDIAFQPGALAVGDTWTATIFGELTCDLPASIDNCALVAIPGGDLDPANDEACATTATTPDTIPPVITIPVDTNFCAGGISMAGTATATDNLAVASISFVDNVMTVGGLAVVSRVWTAIDTCGNASMATQTISVSANTTPPTLQVPAPVNVCNQTITDTNFLVGLSATDASGATIIPVLDSIFTNNPATCEEEIVRLWVASDVCGFRATNVQFITIVTDTNLPVVVPPADILVCAGQTSTGVTGVATATDNCFGPLAIAFTDTIVTNAVGCTHEEIDRVWSATDGCGNIGLATQRITHVVNAGVLSITPPPDISGCDLDTSTNNTGIATIVPGCTDTIISFTDTTNVAAGTTIIVREWRVEDRCGTPATAPQVLTVFTDFSAPILTLPPNISVCNGDTNVVMTGQATGSENCCSASTVTFVDTPIGTACGGGQVIQRLWTATDDCNVSTSAVQLITNIIDLTPPMIMAPSNLFVCGADLSTNITGVATASDNCTSVSFTFTDTIFSAPIGCTPGEIDRVWTATDACGNSMSANQRIRYLPLPGVPSITAPGDMSGCDLDFAISNVGTATVVAACTTTTVTFVDTTNTLSDSIVVLREWTVRDVCGGEDSDEQVLISFLDFAAPSLAIPTNITVCNNETNLSVVGQATAGVSCCSSGTVTFVDTIRATTCGGGQIIDRLWTATDDCGMSTSSVQVITNRLDIDPPIITLPPNAEGCNLDTNVTVLGVATAVNGPDCGEPRLTFFDTLRSADVCSEVYERTWTATDPCGNVDFGVQLITNLALSTPPTLTLPAPVTPPCGVDTSTNLLGSATGSSDCGDVTIAFTDQLTTVGCDVTLARTWTATDRCGTTVSNIQTVAFIDDDQLPVIIVPADITDCNLNTTPFFTGQATATDDCGGTPIIGFTDSSNTVGCTLTIERVWEATDDCGNIALGTQMISSVVDLSGPVFRDVPTGILGCNIDTSTNGPSGTPTVLDNCGATAAPTFSDEVFDSGCATLIIRTWSVVDDCGLSGSFEQFITNRTDTVSPSIVVPEDTLVCGTATNPVDTGFAFFADNCLITTSRFDDTTTATACGSMITRIWSAEDDCGNSVSGTQRIEVVTSVDVPVFVTAVTNASGCNLDTRPAALGTPTATNACGAVAVTFVDTMTASGCTETIQRVWTAAGPCSSATTTQMITNLVDPLPPVILAPEDIEACNLNTNPAFTGFATAADNCGAPVPTWSDAVTVSGTEVTIIRTWSVTDACGQSASAVQTIRAFQDSTPPILAVPADADICSTNLDLSVFALATATDNSDDAPVLSQVDSQRIVGCQVIVDRVWSAEDACGNFTSAVQRIMVTLDETPPTLSIPDNVAVCNAAPGLDTGTAIAADNCTLIDEGFTDTAITNGCLIQIERVWRAVDRCGFTTLGTQEIVFVTDTTPPVVMPPPNLTGCANTFNIDADGGVPTGGDLCSVVSVEATTNQSVNGCVLSVVRTWTATDLCGNTNSASQTIELTVDPDPPVLSVPADVMGCNLPSVSITFLGVATATDACGASSVTSADTVLTNGCTLTILRVWTAIDECGTSISATQEIVNMVDPTPPTITLPPDVDACFLTDFSVAANGMATVADGCSTPSLTFSDTTSTVDCDVVVLRVWTATDACATVSATQTIRSAEDTEPPFISPPADIIGCFADFNINNAGAASVFDDCGNASLNEQVINTSTDCLTDIRRVWTSVDACGNSAIATQIIRVADDNAPPVLTLPANVVSCSTDPDADSDPAVAGMATVSDDCGITVMDFSDTRTTNGCEITIIRGWFAEDLCGLRITNNQTFVFTVDTNPPSFVCNTAPTDLGCNPRSIPPTAPILATVADDCSVVTSAVSVVNITNGCEITQTRVYTATDGCGNMGSCTEIYTWTVDTDRPVLIGCPDPVVLLRSGDPAPNPIVTADGECSPATLTSDRTFLGVNALGDIDVVFTWEAIDCSGLSTSCTARFMYTAPGEITFICPPNIPLDTCGVPPPPAVVATSVCGIATTWVETVSNIVNCSLTVVHTYNAIDNCGVFDSCTQTITARAPEFDPPRVPAPTVRDLGCNAGALPPLSEFLPLIFDNCGILTTRVSVVATTNGCTITDRRIIDVEDFCGNMSQTSQTFTRQDAAALVTWDTFPDSESFCTATAINPAVTGTPTASAACGSATITFTDVTNTVDCATTITRTWSAVNDCGEGRIERDQVLMILGAEAPVITTSPGEPIIVRPNPGSDFIVSDVRSLVSFTACGDATVTQTPTPGTSIPVVFPFTPSITVTISDGCDREVSATVLLTTPPSVGDLVWNDLNMNGVFDAGEPGVPGVPIIVTDQAGTQVGTTTTDANGNYFFYLDATVASARMATSYQISIGDPSLVMTTSLGPFTLAAGEHRRDQDFGVVQFGSIAGVVWQDVNNNNDPSDENLMVLGENDVTLELYRVENGVSQLVETVVTAPLGDTNGYYSVGNLPPGSYVIVLPDQAATAVEGRIFGAREFAFDLGLGQTILPGDSGINFSFTETPTAITISGLNARGGSINLTTASERDTLGFFLRNTTTGEQVGDLTLANGGGSTYAFGAAPGTYELFELTSDLNEVSIGAFTLYPTVDASPVGEPIRFLSKTSFTTEVGVASYLVDDVALGARILDVTGPVTIELIGKTLETDGREGLYFSAPAGRVIEIR